MHKMKRRAMIVLGVLCVGVGVLMNGRSVDALKIPEKYAVPENVSQLAVIRYKKGSQGKFKFYIKNAKGAWKKKFACTAWLGQRGIGKKKRGTRRRQRDFTHWIRRLESGTIPAQKCLM